MATTVEELLQNIKQNNEKIKEKMENAPNSHSREQWKLLLESGIMHYQQLSKYRWWYEQPPASNGCCKNNKKKKKKHHHQNQL